MSSALVDVRRRRRGPTEADEPADEPLEEPAAEPVEEPVEEPLDEPVEEPLEEPVEEPVDEPMEEPLEEPEAAPVPEPATGRCGTKCCFNRDTSATADASWSSLSATASSRPSARCSVADSCAADSDSPSSNSPGHRTPSLASTGVNSRTPEPWLVPLLPPDAVPVEAALLADVASDVCDRTSNRLSPVAPLRVLVDPANTCWTMSCTVPLMSSVRVTLCCVDDSSVDACMSTLSADSGDTATMMRWNSSRWLRSVSSAVASAAVSSQARPE